MTWVRLDDSMTTHPKIVGLTDRAFRLHVAGICYCARFLTDGKVGKKVVKTLSVSAPNRAVNELVSAELWIDHGDHYAIHDFLEYNPSASDVETRKAVRRFAGRLGGQASGRTRKTRATATPSEANSEASASVDASTLDEAKTNPRPRPQELNPYQSALTTTGTVDLIKDRKIDRGRALAIADLYQELIDRDQFTLGRLVKQAQRGASEAMFRQVREELDHVQPTSLSRWACARIDNLMKGAA